MKLTGTKIYRSPFTEKQKMANEEQNGNSHKTAVSLLRFSIKCTFGGDISKLAVIAKDK